MGLFGFFKRNADTNKQTSEGFKLTIDNFKLITHKSKILSIKKSDNFNELFSDYIIDKPKKSGDDLKLDLYTVVLEIWKTSVEINFLDDQKEKLNEAIDIINGKLNWIENNKDLIDSKIISELLNLKNSNWLEANQRPITTKSFLKSIRIKSIFFTKSSEAALTFDDGNLFNGHDIRVEINTMNKITKVDI